MVHNAGLRMYPSISTASSELLILEQTLRNRYIGCFISNGNFPPGHHPAYSFKGNTTYKTPSACISACAGNFQTILIMLLVMTE